MKLTVIANYGAKVKEISINATSDQIVETMNAIDWKKFHQVILETNTGDSMEVGGNTASDGLSVMYSENNLQYVIDNPPSTVEQMTAFLLSYLKGDSSFKTENAFSAG